MRDRNVDTARQKKPRPGAEPNRGVLSSSERQLFLITGVIGILIIPQFGQCTGDGSGQFDTHLADVFYYGEALIGDKDKGRCRAEHARRIPSNPVELCRQDDDQEDRTLLHQAFEADGRPERLCFERRDDAGDIVHDNEKEKVRDFFKVENNDSGYVEYFMDSIPEDDLSKLINYFDGYKS